jgi:hypothetical protein
MAEMAEADVTDRKDSSSGIAEGCWFISSISEVQIMCNITANAARELRKDKGRGTIRSVEWFESDGLLMFHGTIYVPKDRELMCCIVKQHHDIYITGHAGHVKTLVSCNY